MSHFVGHRFQPLPLVTQCQRSRAEGLGVKWEMGLGPENSSTLQGPRLFGWTADRNQLCKDKLQWANTDAVERLEKHLSTYLICFFFTGNQAEHAQVWIHYNTDKYQQMRRLLDEGKFSLYSTARNSVPLVCCPTDQQESHRLLFNIPVRAGEPPVFLPLPLKPSRVCLPEQIKGLSLKIEACHWPAYLNKQ